MDHCHTEVHNVLVAQSADDPLQTLLRARSALSSAPAPLPSVVVGQLVAIADHGASPLVVFAGRPDDAAVHARTVIDLDGSHIGESVLLAFENGDASRPIVTGVLRQPRNLSQAAPDHVSVECDGDRLVLQSRKQLVLKCGDASITLTQAGKVLIQGNFVSTRSTGVNRITGGSVQLN